jgi:hypothetical protein
MFDTEKAFYKAHEADLVSKYAGKRLVIHGQEVFGVYNTDAEACDAAFASFPVGQFMIKRVPQTVGGDKMYIAPLIQRVHYAA